MSLKYALLASMKDCLCLPLAVAIIANNVLLAYKGGVSANNIYVVPLLTYFVASLDRTSGFALFPLLTSTHPVSIGFRRVFWAHSPIETVLYTRLCL